MKYRYIIFDFDMTLVDTSRGSAFCYYKSIEAIGGQFNIKDLNTYMGEFLDCTYNRFSNQLISYSDFEKVFYFYSHEYMAKMSIIFEDVLQFLNDIKLKYKIAIVTNKDRICVNKILDYHKINQSIFECIICCDDVKERKPKPEGLLKCIKQLKCKKKDCIYIGDNINDTLFASNAGVKSYRINRDENLILKEGEIRSLKDLI